MRIAVVALGALLCSLSLPAGAAELDEEAFFKTTCGQCHPSSRVFLVGLEAEERRHVIERMRERWEGGEYAITEDDIERLLDYIESRSGNLTASGERTPGEALEPKALFRERCQGCHQLDRIYAAVKKEREQPGAWMHVVARMRSKAPGWISEEDADRIIAYLRERTVPKVKAPAKIAPDK